MQSRNLWSTTTLLSAAAAMTAVVMVTTDASAYGVRGNKGYNGLDRGYVIAKSRFGNGSQAGRVRQTQLGPQVQLPSGNWEYCRRSCSETLRVETIDFWDARQDGLDVGLAQECGVFGCLDIGVGRRRGY